MPPRRTVQEWITYFEVEPTVRHIFVEGPTDKWICEALFRSLGCHTVAVRTIDEIKLSGAQFFKSPFSSGNRARLISFARLVEAQERKRLHNIICVIDRDCDTLLPVVCESRFVRRTDFANLPIAFAQEDVIRHMIAAVYGRDLSKFNFQTVVMATNFLFAVRIWRYATHPEASHVDPDRSLGRDIQFDYADYLRRFAATNGLTTELQCMAAEVDQLVAKFVGDSRMYMNWDDFVTILYGAVRRLKIPAGISAAEFTRAIRATMDVQRMLSIPLMVDLCAWCGIDFTALNR